MQYKHWYDFYIADSNTAMLEIFDPKIKSGSEDGEAAPDFREAGVTEAVSFRYR